MPLPEPSFSIGIEEEYLLVNRESRDLVDEPPPALVEAFETHLKGHFSTEMLRTQVEVGTSICQTILEVREEVTRLRRIVADLSAEHGLAPIAASTHPFARWKDQKRTDKERYHVLQRSTRSRTSYPTCWLLAPRPRFGRARTPACGPTACVYSMSSRAPDCPSASKATESTAERSI